MLRALNLRLPKGKIISWTDGKPFGFAQVAGEDGSYLPYEDPSNRIVLVHTSSIIKNPSGRTAKSIRKGTEIEFEVAMYNEKESATNVSLSGGEVLTSRNEVIGSTIDIGAMRSKLLPPGTTAKIKDGEKVGYHDYITSVVIDKVDTINKCLRETEMLNRKTLRILEAIAQKKGIEKFPIGDEYNGMKDKIWEKYDANANEYKAARKVRNEVSDSGDNEDDVHEELFSVRDEENETSVNNNKESHANEEPKRDDAFYSPDDLLKETEEINDGKKKKGKKSKI